MSSSANLCKQFGQARHNVSPELDPSRYDTLIVKNFLKKLFLKKNLQATKKNHEKLPCMQRVIT